MSKATGPEWKNGGTPPPLPDCCVRPPPPPLHFPPARPSSPAVLMLLPPPSAVLLPQPETPDAEKPIATQTPTRAHTYTVQHTQAKAGAGLSQHNSQEGAVSTYTEMLRG